MKLLDLVPTGFLRPTTDDYRFVSHHNSVIKECFMFPSRPNPLIALGMLLCCSCRL